MMQSKLQVNGLCYQYGATKALDGVSFDVVSGEFFGIVGPNGGGKSTLFSLLATLRRPLSGTILVDGIDSRTLPHEVRKKIGIVFQQPALDKKLTVRENLKCQAMLYGIDRKERDSRIDEMLRWLNLIERANDRVETLSGGLARRVEIARGVLHSPEILLLDEPTTGLDPLARQQVWDELFRLNQERKMTLLLTTHLLDEANRCDRVVMLDGGTKVALGTPAELKASVGSTALVIRSDQPEKVAQLLKQTYEQDPIVRGKDVVVHWDAADSKFSEIREKLGGHVESMSLGQPSLDDFFLQKTGKRLEDTRGAA